MCLSGPHWGREEKPELSACVTQCLRLVDTEDALSLGPRSLPLGWYRKTHRPRKSQGQNAGVLVVALVSHLCPRTQAFSECLWRKGGNYGSNVLTLKTWLRQVIQLNWVPIRWECVPTQLQRWSANGFQAQWCLPSFLMDKKSILFLLNKFEEQFNSPLTEDKHENKRMTL